MKELSDLQTGATLLLYETTSLLNDLGVNYIIVGGWSPFLLNSAPHLHPGTKDVDVLFDKAYEKGKLSEIILEFISHGYLLSAKHDFQLFKSINVAGKPFIYNVDLLHPLETIKPTDIYVEQIDLGIPADKYLSETFKMKSIALPSSQSLFDCEIVTNYSLGNPICKQQKQHEIPLMTELGTLITKSRSVFETKRYRDSLDIYLAIKQCRDYNLLIGKINLLRRKDVNTYNTLYGIKEAYDKEILITNTSKFIPHFKKDEFTLLFENFFHDALLNLPATN